MGNEQSQLPGLDIDEKAIEVSDFWSQHCASIAGSENVTNLSVFIGEIFVDGSLWTSQTPLEKCAKNLMIFRHPCILKYISSWQNNSKFHLAVEEVIPLAQFLSKLNTLQISVGMHSVLKALDFLHENASASHNNICTSSIYVTKDGSWKLGGMEYLSRYKDMGCEYLTKTRNHRYGRSVDPNEEQLLDSQFGRRDFIDIYAFGALVGEILKCRSDGNAEEEIPALSAFRSYCKEELQNTDISKRPSFRTILNHEFFDQDFITIHSFLVELPLKSDEEKSAFFEVLVDKLRLFDEQMVAAQLSGLLLSRLVLLNARAQERLLPMLLTPKMDADDQFQSDSIFSEESFKIHLRPKLLDIFRVRDAQIRLLLLQHFPKFMHVFTREELQTGILPELLLGIKDTDDHLVAVTLRALADLVTVLGAAMVIGGKRAKLFNDGRPVKVRTAKRVAFAPLPADAPGCGSDGTIRLEAGDGVVEVLPERPRPDGEEEETSTEEIDVSLDGENEVDNWDDWGINEAAPRPTDRHESVTAPDPPQVPTTPKAVDIDALDVKSRVDVVEVDFFQDMEPVIASAQKFLIEEGEKVEQDVSAKLALDAADDVGEEGWGEEEDWG